MIIFVKENGDIEYNYIGKGLSMQLLKTNKEYQIENVVDHKYRKSNLFSKYTGK